YMTYCADRWARRFDKIPRQVRGLGLNLLRRLWPVSDQKISFEYKLKRMLEGSLLPADEAHFFWNGTCSPSQIRTLCPSLRGPGLQALFGAIPGPAAIGFLNRYLLVDDHYYPPHHLLSTVDLLTLAH